MQSYTNRTYVLYFDDGTTVEVAGCRYEKKQSRVADGYPQGFNGVSSVYVPAQYRDLPGLTFYSYEVQGKGIFKSVKEIVSADIGVTPISIVVKGTMTEVQHA